MRKKYNLLLDSNNAWQTIFLLGNKTRALHLLRTYFQNNCFKTVLNIMYDIGKSMNGTANDEEDHSNVLKKRLIRKIKKALKATDPILVFVYLRRIDLSIR